MKELQGMKNEIKRESYSEDLQQKIIKKLDERIKIGESAKFIADAYRDKWNSTSDPEKVIVDLKKKLTDFINEGEKQYWYGKIVKLFYQIKGNQKKNNPTKPPEVFPSKTRKDVVIPKTPKRVVIPKTPKEVVIKKKRVVKRVVKGTSFEMYHGNVWNSYPYGKAHDPNRKTGAYTFYNG
jgi:hypothetical protein